MTGAIPRRLKKNIEVSRHPEMLDVWEAQITGSNFRYLRQYHSSPDYRPICCL